MPDVVVPFAKSNGIDFELKYCLRSIEKYLPDFGNIFIIGGQPSWIQNHIHIPFDDLPGSNYKQFNIYSKILHACDDKRISDDFYCTSDDVFLLDSYKENYDHAGLLSEAILNYHSRQNYKKVLENTLHFLGTKALNVGHGPIIYNKELFKRSVATVNWKQVFGYAVKVLYVNMNKLAGEYREDIKINKRESYFLIGLKLLYEHYFSINDYGINDDLMKVLDELYPEKSQFEK